MTTIRVTIDNKSHARQLGDFLKTIGYVKNVQIEEPTGMLTDDDWIMPGRPATEAKIDKLLDDMEADEGGITTRHLKKKIAKWNKGIYK